MYPLIYLALVLVPVYLYCGRPSGIRRNGRKLPHAPNTLPLFGNGILFLRARHKLLRWLLKCESQFGFQTYEITVPTLPPAVVIHDPKNVDYVLKNEPLFDKGGFIRQRSWDLFGHGIINVDGPQWRIQRKAGLRFFSTTNLKTLIDVFVPRFLADTRTDLRRQAHQRSVFDLEEVFLEFTTRLMGRAAYDMNMRASSPFSHAFDFASGAIGERFQNPLWQFSEIFFGAPLRHALKEVKSYGRLVVATAIKARQEGVTGETSDLTEPANPLRGSLIKSLLEAIDDPEVVADAALNYLSAGRDTTAQALTWTFYLLMRHPRVVSELRAELHNRPETLSFDTVQPHALPYTLAVFYESLRLYPPVPIEMKQCAASTTLPDGTMLPAHAIVIWSPWAMGRSAHIWGEDASAFSPERWLEDAAAGAGHARKVKVKSPSEFPVFNGGPRTCLGKQMAELQSVFVIASLVRDFDFIECKDLASGEAGHDGERESRNSLTLPMAGGLPCRVNIRVSPKEI
ncbi:MAG: hypothetical protein M1838_002340 [Thelocarpon superellum]|nr:MAG: hypothetical protein M1838_002340 [Thelocarpon superellum]